MAQEFSHGAVEYHTIHILLHHIYSKFPVLQDQQFLSQELQQIMLQNCMIRVINTHADDKVLAIVQQLQPDVIMLTYIDYIPPVGISLFKLIRTEPQTAHIPFIFMPASNERDDKIRALALGADGYIDGPSRNPQNIMNELRRILEPKYACWKNAG